LLLPETRAMKRQIAVKTIRARKPTRNSNNSEVRCSEKQFDT
jgi:hypothetical protein